MTTEIDNEVVGAASPCYQFADGGWRTVAGVAPEEAEVPVFVNGQELVTILCTPEKLNCLIVGFLAAQGLISGLGDITAMRICAEERLADVRLKNEVAMPKRRLLTSGCGGGVSFELGVGMSPVACARRFTPAQVLAAIRMLLQSETGAGEDRHRGLHTSALGDGEHLLAVAHDIGRHNTLDKIWGECLLRKIPTAGNILVSTGRISSEMLIKAVKMGVPVVASLNSATQRAVELGGRLGVTVVGYARGSQFTVFCGRERIESVAGEPAK